MVQEGPPSACDRAHDIRAAVPVTSGPSLPGEGSLGKPRAEHGHWPRCGALTHPSARARAHTHTCTEDAGPLGCVVRTASVLSQLRAWAQSGLQPGDLVLCYQRLHGPGGGGGPAVTDRVQLREEVPSPGAMPALAPVGPGGEALAVLRAGRLQSFRSSKPQEEELNQQMRLSSSDLPPSPTPWAGGRVCLREKAVCLSVGVSAVIPAWLGRRELFETQPRPFPAPPQKGPQTGVAGDGVSV